MTFSRRSMYFQRASSRTIILLSDGMALKSKLSKLLTAGNLAILIRRSTIRAINQLQFGQANKVTHMIDALGSALAGLLVVFP